ncbi:hypothetical protein ABTO37_19460, partial [Acinetobacter baumannii]
PGTTSLGRTGVDCMGRTDKHRRVIVGWCREYVRWVADGLFIVFCRGARGSFWRFTTPAQTK